MHAVDRGSVRFGGPWRVQVQVHAGPARLSAGYWLAHSHGFLVDEVSGRAVGVVEDVVSGEGSALPEGLVVAAGWNGRHRLLVSVDAVVEIVPADHRLVVERPAGSLEEVVAAGVCRRSGRAVLRRVVGMARGRSGPTAGR